MIAARRLNFINKNGRQLINFTIKSCESTSSKPPAAASPTETQPEIDATANSSSFLAVPLKTWQKFIVKNFGRTKYKSISDVPDSVSVATWTISKDHARAKISVLLVGLTFVGAYITVQLARHDKEAGKESPHQILQRERMQSIKSD